MNVHKGEHKRMGATDVVPFLPIQEMTTEECNEISREVGKAVWERFQLPVFLYESTATAPNRVSLPDIRKGEYEGMAEKLKQPEWAPDFGERAPHPTAGVTAIGCRMPLIAFNINLATTDMSIPKEIAKDMKEKISRMSQLYNSLHRISELSTWETMMHKFFGKQKIVMIYQYE